MLPERGFGGICKKAFVFLGSEGDNGKSTFTKLIQLTLGDYAVTGHKSSITGPDQATLDPDLVEQYEHEFSKAVHKAYPAIAIILDTL